MSIRSVTGIGRDRWDDRWARGAATGAAAPADPVAPPADRGGNGPAGAPGGGSATRAGTSASTVAPVDLVLWERALVAPRLEGLAPMGAPRAAVAWPRDPVLARAASLLGLGERFSQTEVDRRFREIVAAERPDLGLVDGDRLRRLRAARDALRGHLRAARWVLPEQPG